jgi:hypothetical protein
MPLAVAEADSRCGVNLVLISCRVLSGGETEISSRNRLRVTGSVASWPTAVGKRVQLPRQQGQHS